MRNIRLDEAQAGIKIARRNINNLRYADDTNLMAESEEELKGLLVKVKEESCRGPASADPGYSKRGRRRRPIYIYLFIKDSKSNRMRIAQ